MKGWRIMGFDPLSLDDARPGRPADEGTDDSELRYGLTALGEAFLAAPAATAAAQSSDPAR